MARAQKDLPDTEEGHLERLRRTQERTERVLSCRAAQNSGAPEMGTKFIVNVSAKSGEVIGLDMPAPDPEELAVAAILARPFSLEREAIYGPKVAKSLLRFARSQSQKQMSDQVARMWRSLPLNRMKTFAVQADGTLMLPSEGVWDGQIADRVLYSQLVHADDSSDILNHIDDAQLRWSLASYVGDWLAVVAHQQQVLQWLRPDVCPELTSWAGTPRTIFDRLGVEPQAITPDS